MEPKPGVQPLEARRAELHAVGGVRESIDGHLIWELFEAAPDGIVLTDETGRMLLVNRETERLFGYERHDLLGRAVEELVPERFQAVHRAHRSRYQAHPRSRSIGAGLQLLGRRADGSEFPVEISLSPLGAAGGTWVVATIRDITDRVTLEAWTREVFEILDATRDAVSILDARTLRFTYVNQGMTDQLGYSSSQLHALSMLDVAPRFTREALRELLAPFERREISATTFQTVHRRRDGSELPVEILLQAVPDENGHPRSYVKIARDISERLESDARLQRAEQERRVFEDRERTARDLHDLVVQRLFATGMALQATASLPDSEDRGPRIQQAVDEIDWTIREIRAAVFDLQFPDATASGGLRERILAVIDEARPALGFAPHITLSGPVDSIGDGVARQLLAGLRELLSNVARHAHASRVDVDVVADGDEVVLRVVDDGAGFDPTTSERGNGLTNLAERAERVDGTFTVRQRSAGGTVAELRSRSAG